MSKIELKNINIRKRVVDLLEAANKRKESKIHVHINDDRIVDISDDVSDLQDQVSTHTNNIASIVSDVSLNKINIAINSNCDHICVVDYVDISEERMQKITYCEKCWTPLPLLEKVEQKL